MENIKNKKKLKGDIFWNIIFNIINLVVKVYNHFKKEMNHSKVEINLKRENLKGTKETRKVKQGILQNQKIKEHKFLKEMYQDEYFPKFLVDKIKQTLIRFSYDIETKKPKDEKEVYKLSHSATMEINDLAKEFEENDSEIESIARDNIGSEFEFICKSYGYINIDNEELISPREW